MEPVLIRPIPIAEILDAHALVAEYVSESAIDGLPKPQPSREIYAMMEATGALQPLGAFIGDRLVGFAVLLVTVNPHSGVPLGVTESLFVASAYRKRGVGLKLLRAVEAAAGNAGAEGLLVSSGIDSQLDAVLARLHHYRPTNRAYFRGLA